MLPIQRKISNYNYSSRKGNSVKYIVLHYTGNEGDTAKDNVDYFSNGDRNASAHYFVDDNSIWQSVEESNAAWAVGDGKGKYGITNQNSISIEMCCNSNEVISEKTENNALELVKYLQSKYKISNNNVVRHYDASRKNCPNWSNNNWSRWNSFKGKLSGSYEVKNNEFNEEDYPMYLFSENWYRFRYKDVDDAIKKGSFKSGYEHYIKYGIKENPKRQALPPIPSNFNEGDYLELNQDIKKAVSIGSYVSGIHHFMLHGFKESHRKINKGETDEVAKKRVKELELKLEEIKKIVE